MPDAWRNRGYQLLRESFARPTSDGEVSAVRVIDDPEVDAELVHRVVNRFLETVGIAESA